MSIFNFVSPEKEPRSRELTPIESERLQLVNNGCARLANAVYSQFGITLQQAETTSASAERSDSRPAKQAAPTSADQPTPIDTGNIEWSDADITALQAYVDKLAAEPNGDDSYAQEAA